MITKWSQASTLRDLKLRGDFMHQLIYIHSVSLSPFLFPFLLSLLSLFPSPGSQWEEQAEGSTGVSRQPTTDITANTTTKLTHNTVLCVFSSSCYRNYYSPNASKRAVRLCRTRVSYKTIFGDFHPLATISPPLKFLFLIWERVKLILDSKYCTVMMMKLPLSQILCESLSRVSFHHDSCSSALPRLLALRAPWSWD